MTGLWIRVEGNSTIGSGHLVRCLALYENLPQPFRCTLIISSASETAARHLFAGTDADFFVLADAITIEEETDQLSRIVPHGDTLVIDGYQFDYNYQSKLKPLFRKLIYIDDLVTRPICADVVINYTEGIDAALFSVDPGTQLCLGFRYLLLRKPFFTLAKSRGSFQQDANHVFVSFGGADPGNYTIAVLEALKQLPGIASSSVHVVTGVSYQRTEELNQLLNDVPYTAQHYSALSTEQLTGLFKQCGKAITSSSTIALEYLHSGGELYAIETADNQHRLYTFLLQERMALPFGDFGRGTGTTDKEKISRYFTGQTNDLTQIIFS